MLKPKLYLVAMILAMLAIVAGGCVGSSPTPSGAQLEITCDEFAKQNHISQAVDVPVNGVLTVNLCSNQTTGFQWSETAEITDPSVLKQLGHEFVAPEQEGLVGAAGQEVWRFQALKKGESTISMSYSRPWEGGEKGEWTFTLNVTVK